jgi:hypothetical protein
MSVVKIGVSLPMSGDADQPGECRVRGARPAHSSPHPSRTRRQPNTSRRAHRELRQADSLTLAIDGDDWESQIDILAEARELLQTRSTTPPG